MPFLSPTLNLGALLDGEQHLAKAFGLTQLIAGGDLWPRWTPNFYGGYGYPTFIFYAPATYYALVALAGLLPVVDLHSAFQLLGAAAALGIVSGVYAWGWSIWRHAPAAVLASVSTAYAPYLLQTNLFIRGALPEVAGLALLSWLLWAVTRLWQSLTILAPTVEPARRAWWALVSLVAALLLTHNVSAVIGAGLAVGWIWCLWLWRPQLRAVLWVGSAAALGALATAFFWLPALLETPLVQVERMYRGNLHYRNWFLTWPGFHAPLWGLPERSPWTPGAPVDLHLVYRHALYGAPKLSLWQSLALGTAAMAGGAWLWRRRWRRSGGGTPAAPWRSDRCSLTLLSLGYGISVALLCYAQSFDWTLPWWERFPAVRALQAPYRLLGAAGYGVALATGGALTLWARPSRQAWMGAVVVAGVLATIALAGRDVPIVADISHTAGTPAAIARERAQPGTTASTDEFLPRTADFQTWHEGEARGFWLYERLFPEASWIAGRLLVWEGDVSVHSLRGGALWTSAGVTAGAGGAVVAVHQLAFPGWRAWVDGRRVAVAPAPEIATQAIRPGFMLVAVPPGRHDVAVRFGADPLHLLATSVTLLTMTTVAWRGLAHTGIARWRPALRRRQGEAQRDPLGRVGALALARGATVIVALLIGGCTLAPLRPSWGLFGFTSAPTNEVVIGVVDTVLAGRTTLRSPSGDTLGPDRFLDVRPLTLWAQDRPLRDAGPRTRRWLFTHAPAEVAVDVLVPRDALFQSALAIDPAAWSAALGDGVRFVVGVTPEGGGETVVLDSVVQPRGRGEQRRWLDVVADLRPWAGQSVRLSLRTDPRQDPSFDWSGWAEPVVVRVDPLTADRLLRSTAELQERVLRP